MTRQTLRLIRNIIVLNKANEERLLTVYWRISNNFLHTPVQPMNEFAMSSQKRDLVKLVKEEDLSSIAVIADRLEADEETVREMLNKIVEAGEINGYITEDGTRFFRSDYELDHEVASEEEDVPDFMKFNPLPGQITAAIGFIIVVISIAGFLLSSSMETENMMLILLLVGLGVMFSGCYYLGTRKTA